MTEKPEGNLMATEDSPEAKAPGERLRSAYEQNPALRCFWGMLWLVPLGAVIASSFVVARWELPGWGWFAFNLTALSGVSVFYGMTKARRQLQVPSDRPWARNSHWDFAFFFFMLQLFGMPFMGIALLGLCALVFGAP